MDTTGYFLNLL